jgi:hypothetical protein
MINKVTENLVWRRTMTMPASSISNIVFSEELKICQGAKH